MDTNAKQYFTNLWARYEDLPGWLSRAEAEILFRCALNVPEGQDIAEIGSWKGKSAVFIASALKYRQAKDIHLYCLDLFTGSPEHHKEGEKVWTFEEFSKNIKTAGVEDYITGIVGDAHAPEQHDQVPSNLGMVFIDGDHSYEGALADFEIFGDKLQPGGTVLFHDTIWWRGVHKLMTEKIFFAAAYSEVEWAGSIIKAKKLPAGTSRTLFDRAASAWIYLTQQLYFAAGFLKAKIIPVPQNDGK